MDRINNNYYYLIIIIPITLFINKKRASYSNYFELSRSQLNDDINGRSDPEYRLIPSVSDLNYNSQQPRLGERRDISTTN